MHMLKLKGKLFKRVLRLILNSLVIVKPCQDFSVKTALMLLFFFLREFNKSSY